MARLMTIHFCTDACSDNLRCVMFDMRQTNTIPQPFIGYPPITRPVFPQPGVEVEEIEYYPDGTVKKRTIHRPAFTNPSYPPVMPAPPYRSPSLPVWPPGQITC